MSRQGGDRDRNGWGGVEMRVGIETETGWKMLPAGF